MQHIYNPDFQNQNLAARTTAAFDKLADVFKTMLWASQKKNGFSPLQLKLLLYTAYHKPTENTINQFVEEFKITKATVSDCIKTLEKQELLTKVLNHKDNRRFQIQLTDHGKQIISQIEEYSSPLLAVLNTEKKEDLEQLYISLFSLLSKLDAQNIMPLRRSCADCKAYRSDGINHAFCMQLRIQLPSQNRRIDCPTYQNT